MSRPFSSTIQSIRQAPDFSLEGACYQPKQPKEAVMPVTVKLADYLYKEHLVLYFMREFT